MDVRTRPLDERTLDPWRLLLTVAGALVLFGLVLRLVNPDQFGWSQTFIVIFSALLVEALPFVLLGALVAALIEVFVPVSVFEKLGRLPHSLQVPAAGIAGAAFPVCDCGSVPVARRLARKGLNPSAAITFMLTAPVLNPVVIASTLIAYRGRTTMWEMVGGRFVLGLVVAIAVGYVVGPKTKEELLRPRPGDDHVDEHAEGRRWDMFVGHVADDFLFMGKYLMVGAIIAAGFQTLLPQSLLKGIAGTPILDIIVMMGLAFFLSLCSESDAFFAASFVQFGPAAQLAFLVFGPMMDMKLSSLYVGTYNKGFFRMAFFVVAAVTLAGALWFKVLFG